MPARTTLSADLVAILIGLTMSIGAPIASRAADSPLARAATDLARQYDANYARKDAAAMAMLYAPDGILVSPSGPIIRGREALKAYYTKRFASGANSHAIRIIDVRAQGDGGFSLAQFSVATPGGGEGRRSANGTIAAVYQHDTDGWHYSLVEPSVPEAGK